MNKKIILFLIAATTVAYAQGSIIITGVVDGSESGGIPKGAELMAAADIADLSIYSIGRYSNGASTLSSITLLPMISLSAGDFFYITGSTTSDTFFSSNGFTVGLSNQSVLNVNGDDLLQIVLTSDITTAVDTFGLPGQGDTDFYADSIAYRNPNLLAGNATGLTDASNFTITNWVDSATFGSTFGTYAVPEPSTYAALLGLLALGLVAWRRWRA